jgi:hypothetical protein
MSVVREGIIVSIQSGRLDVRRFGDRLAADIHSPKALG